MGVDWGQPGAFGGNCRGSVGGTTLRCSDLRWLGTCPRRFLGEIPQRSEALTPLEARAGHCHHRQSWVCVTSPPHGTGQYEAHARVVGRSEDLEERAPQGGLSPQRRPAEPCFLLRREHHRKGMFSAGMIPNIQEHLRHRNTPKRGRQRFFKATLHALRTRAPGRPLRRPPFILRSSPALTPQSDI